MRSTPVVNIGDEVVVDRPQTSGQSTADKMTSEVRSKLSIKSKTLEPYKVLSVQTHTVKKDEAGLQNTVSIYRITPSPRQQSAQAQGVPVTEDKGGVTPTAETPTAQTNDTEDAYGLSGGIKNELPVELIVRHTDSGRNRIYVVRWYGCRSQD